MNILELVPPKTVAQRPAGKARNRTPRKRNWEGTGRARKTKEAPWWAAYTPLTMRELARVCGYTVRHMVRILNLQVAPRVDTLGVIRHHAPALAKALEKQWAGDRAV